MTRPIFVAENTQIEMCGTPPTLMHSEATRKNVGYFQNCYGEQSMSEFDKETRELTVYLGDYSWEKPGKFVVPEGVKVEQIADLISQLPFTLGNDEFFWLSAVVLSCGA